MQRLVAYIDSHPKAFYIAVLYVGVGTLAVCSVYPHDFFHGDWIYFALIITFPVDVISFAYRYAEPDLLFPVFIIQTVMLVLTFWLASKWEDKRG